MRYLLAFIYEKDYLAHYSQHEYKHKTNIIKNNYQNLVDNDFNLDEENVEEKSSQRNKPYNLGHQKNNTAFALKGKSLIFLYEYENLNKNKIRENLFQKVIKYYFIKDVPLDKVPNIIPNFYCQENSTYSLINNYLSFKKFIIFEIDKPKEIQKNKTMNINIDNSFDNKDNSKKDKESEDEEDHENSFASSESHVERFLDEISSDSNDGFKFARFNMKRISKKVAIVYTNKEYIALKKNKS